MIYAKELITEVARYLSDYDEAGEPEYQFREWSERDLLSYFKLAISTIAMADPKLFSTTVSVPISDTGLIALPPECEDCLGILQYISDDGKVTNQPPYTEKVSFTTTRPTCGGIDPKKVVPSVVRTTNDRRVLLSTPVGTGGKLILSCSNSPNITTVDGKVDIPARYSGAVFNLMVSYAYGVDIESAVMRARSDEHWSRASALLPVALKTKGNE